MRRNYYIERISALVAAVLLLQTLFYKFSAATVSVYIFSEMGLEPYGRIGIGLAELITALLLLFRKTSHVGALLGIGLMTGAIFSHVFVLGIEVLDDKGLLFTLAIIVFMFCLVIAYLKKEGLLRMIKQRRIFVSTK